MQTTIRIVLKELVGMPYTTWVWHRLAVDVDGAVSISCDYTTQVDPLNITNRQRLMLGTEERFGTKCQRCEW